MKWSWSSIDEGRMERAKEVKIDSIDTVAETAVFVGSKNDRHSASLSSCSCTDFARLHKPCKHMIRLACELNKLDELCDYHVTIDDSDEPPKEEKRPGKKPNAYLSLSDYVVVDLETTGLNVNEAAVLEFAAVRVVNNRVVDTFSTLVNTGAENTAQNINHITADMTAAAPSLQEAFERFMTFIGDSPVVGHNLSSFDSSIIYDLSQTYFNKPFTNDIVDTLLFSRSSHHDIKSYRLADMCEYYGITNTQPHRALGDALCTQELYERIKYYFYSERPHPVSFVLGGYSDSIIYENILRITADTAQNIILRINKTGSSIFMFGSLAFSIKMNSRSQYIETTATAAEEYVSLIPGASSAKTGYRFPIACDKDTATAYEEMISAVYEQLKSSTVSERFGCCNDFIRCSDARECLHKDNPEYNGCYYRKNLESGRIFYGKNKNQ